MTNVTLILLAIFLPVIISPLIAILGIKLKGRTAWLALPLPVFSLLSIITLAHTSGWGTSQVLEVSWIPRLGINLSFLFDGLSTVYGLIVSGMGILIVFYARFYLGEKYKFQNRFYAYLMLFMAAMLGTVFSNNLMLLFIFWELTGLMSFFLIGFLHDQEKSRLGARMALIVTGVTGLMIMVGVIITGMQLGTYSLSEIFSHPEFFAEHKSWMNVALIFLMIGAFGKSAQFPFQFWLPNAMAAPTPVSAYLHCATMVKLGVFLTARIYPVFVHCDLWGPLIMTIGFITMVLGSYLAFQSHDLKAILAYSTVAQLGFLIGFYGMGTEAGIQHDYFHILNHVFYKGSLFMIAGIIDHATGTRDIRKLGGLFRFMPMLAVAFIVLNLCMAGIPGTMGFVSKELMLEHILHTVHLQGGGGYWLLPLGMFAYAIFMVAFSVRLFHNAFFGPFPAALKGHVHKPCFLFQLPALIPAVFVIIFGLFPQILGAFLMPLSVSGLQTIHREPLALWHGFTTPLLMSFVMIVCGLGLFYFAQRKQWRFASIPVILRFDEAFDFLYDKMVYHAKTVTAWLKGDQSFDFLPVIIAACLTIIGGYFVILFNQGYAFDFGESVMPGHLGIIVFIFIVLGILGTVFYTTWIKRLVALSVTGFMITFYYVIYRAPDLALTQLMIETVSLILMLLFLTRLPKSCNTQEQALTLSRARHVFAITVSLTMGVLVFVLILIVTANPGEVIGPYFLENTIPLAQGRNAVNTVIVDFRGYDTMGEITVLVVAMLGVLGLLMRKRGTR